MADLRRTDPAHPDRDRGHLHGQPRLRRRRRGPRGGQPGHHSLPPVLQLHRDRYERRHHPPPGRARPGRGRLHSHQRDRHQHLARGRLQRRRVFLRPSHAPRDEAALEPHGVRAAVPDPHGWDALHGVHEHLDRGRAPRPPAHARRDDHHGRPERPQRHRQLHHPFRAPRVPPSRGPRRRPLRHRQPQRRLRRPLGHARLPDPPAPQGTRLCHNLLAQGPQDPPHRTAGRRGAAVLLDRVHAGHDLHRPDGQPEPGNPVVHAPDPAPGDAL